MLSTVEPETADEVYALGLAPADRGPVRRVLLGALDLWCATVGGGLELSGAAQVVVRERWDGRTVLSLPAQTAEVAALTVAGLREDLETLSPEEFRTAWQLTP